MNSNVEETTVIARKFGIGVGAALLMIGGIACSGSSDDSAADPDKEAIEAGADQGAQPEATDNTGGGTASNGGDTKTVPDGWPEILAVPDGFTIETSQSRTMEDGRDLSRVEAIGEGDLKEIFDTYEQAVTDAGYQTEFKSDLNEVYHLNASGDEWEVEVVVEESQKSDTAGKASIALKYMSIP